MGVHAHHGDLDWASKVEIVVAQVVGGCLKVVLVETTGVVDNLVEYWLGSGNCSLVRDHIEVEYLVTLLLDETRVDDCAGARVQAVLILLGEESVLDVAVDQAVHDLRLVSLGRVLKHVGDDFDFMALDLSGHRRTTHAVSVDNNLIRKCLSFFVEVSNSLVNEILDNFSSLNGCENLLNLSLCLSRILLELLLANSGHLLLV